MKFLKQYSDLLIAVIISGAAVFLIYHLFIQSDPTRLACFDGTSAVTCAEPNVAPACKLDGQIVQCSEARGERSICFDANGKQASCDYIRYTNLSQVLLGFLPVVGWLIAHFVGENRRFDLTFFPVLPKSGERKNTILLVGLGRSGKSELIKSMASSLHKIPPRPTDKWKIYRFQMDQHNGKTLSYTINDYRGQKLSQVTANFVLEQMKRDSLFRYNDINTIILVVDLFSYDENEEPEKTYPEIEKKRIDEHIAQWSEMALDAVFGLLTKESLTGVFLFINKLDKLQTGLNLTEAQKQIDDAYDPLIQDLMKRAHESEAAFGHKIGSVLTGQGVAGSGGVLQFLNAHSVPRANGRSREVDTQDHE